jgi:predicted nucleic acid-binding protein
MRAGTLAGDRNVDFADAYLALQTAEHGETVCTFDESDFRRLPLEGTVPG